jgi:biotin transport system substrate-specific component
VALYLAQGFAGLPVFAGAATGPAYLMGPTAGYLVGFAAAAAVVGWLVQRGGARSVARMVVVMAVGSAVILSLGVAWLSAAIGFERAVAVGLLPFLTGDVLKTALAAATLPLAWRAIDRKA